MTAPVTRAEFEALCADVATIRDGLAEALRLTGCTDPVNNRRDRDMRDRQAWRESPEGQAHEATLREMVDWFRAEKQARAAAKDTAQARRETRRDVQIGIAALLGIVALAQLVGGWIVHALRGLTGGAP